MKWMKRIRNERGSVAVEFGLVAPIMFLLVFGLIDFGRAYHAIHELSAAAREGARYAAPLADPLASEVEIRERVKYFAVTFAGDQLTDDQIEVEFDGGSVTVRIRDYPFQFLALPFGTINITRQATMRWERI